MQEELPLSELFAPISRTDRQKEAVREWIKHKCVGCFEFPTGFGKTYTAIMTIKVLMKKFADLKVIVVVPTDTLQQQWIKNLDRQGLSLNCEVLIINTAIKHSRECDFLIIDEVHRTGASQFSQIFTTFKYKYILGLTATLERLDGRHEYIKKYCPVVDKVSTVEAVANGWLAKSIEYKVILDVKDIDEYKTLNKEFTKHLEYFGYDFNLVMSLLGKDGYKKRLALRDEMLKANKTLDKTETLRSITLHAMEAVRILQVRKKFINNHPDKVRLTQEIIKHRPLSKIITFSATIENAEKIGIGYVYSSKQTKKKGRATIDEFTRMERGVLNTSKKADEGLDVPGIDTLVILGQDSSPTRWIQRKGRAIRKEGDKIAEIFVFVINDTVENEWYNNSHKNSDAIPISEEGLMHVLKGEDYELYKKPVKKFTYRF